MSTATMISAAYPCRESVQSGAFAPAAMRARSERGRLPGSGDLSQHIDQPLISFTVLFREARHDVAKVVFVEAGALIDRAGQEALAKRTEGYEADTQLFQQRQDFF